MKPETKPVITAATASKDKTTITTSIIINIDTYQRVQEFMINEYKRTGERLFLKDIVSPAIDLYIATSNCGGSN